MRRFSHRRSRRQRALPSPRHPLATTQWYRPLLLAAHGLRHTPDYALSMGMTHQFFFLFCPWWPWPWPWHANSGEIFEQCTYTAKFHHPTFSRSEVIMRTNKQTNKHTNIQTPLKTSTALRCATPVGNYSGAKTIIKAHIVVVLQTKSNVPIASSITCNMINDNCCDTVGSYWII